MLFSSFNVFVYVCMRAHMNARSGVWAYAHKAGIGNLQSLFHLILLRLGLLNPLLVSAGQSH